MANRRRKPKSDETKKARKSEPANQNREAKTPKSGQEADPSVDPSKAPRAPAAPSNDNEKAPPKQPVFPRMPSLSRVMSVVMLMIGILAVGALFYKVMAGFFVPLFLATLLVVIFRPVHLWIYEKTGQKPRVAALATTSLILLVVLLPIIVIISAAASQFTAIVSHVNHFENLSSALERARGQVSLSLPHSEQFRRLDVLADSLDVPEKPDQVLADITEARRLLAFLQREFPDSGPAEDDAGKADERLRDFAASIEERKQLSADDTSEMITATERFHRQSASASAAIRTWMKTILGGAIRSQVILLANPSDADFAKLLRTSRDALQPRFVQVTSATGVYLLGGVVSLLILVVSVYFFLLDGPSMIRTLMRLSPMDDNYERRLLMEFDRTSRAVVLASILSALVQGLLAAVAFYFLGFDSVILLFLLTTMMALVPFLGAASVWVPCALWLGAVEQRWFEATLLALYGATIVSSIDNVIKMYVLHGRSTLHPLFALLSVFGGVKVFGPIGVLVGPMVVVFLQTLLEILNHELVSTETDESQAARAAEVEAAEA